MGVACCPWMNDKSMKPMADHIVKIGGFGFIETTWHHLRGSDWQKMYMGSCPVNYQRPTPPGTQMLENPVQFVLPGNPGHPKRHNHAPRLVVFLGIFHRRKSDAPDEYASNPDSHALLSGRILTKPCRRLQAESARHARLGLDRLICLRSCPAILHDPAQKANIVKKIPGFDAVKARLSTDWPAWIKPYPKSGAERHLDDLPGVG